MKRCFVRIPKFYVGSNGQKGTKTATHSYGVNHLAAIKDLGEVCRNRYEWMANKQKARFRNRDEWREILYAFEIYRGELFGKARKNNNYWAFNCIKKYNTLDERYLLAAAELFVLRAVWIKCTQLNTYRTYSFHLLEINKNIVTVQ